MIFKTRVNNIPCQCRVLFSQRAPKDALPEFEFMLLDRKGYPAPWLERYVDKRVEFRLYKEYTDV